MSEEVMVNIIGLGSIDITRICIFVVFIKKSNMTFNMTFNLKNYLLGLYSSLATKLGFESMGIFYCENANTHKIELIGNDSDFKGVLLEFSENIPKAPNEISQFLTNFKNSKIPNKEILFSATEKYPSISPNKLCEYFKKRIRDIFERYWWHGYSKIPQEKRIAKIKEQVNEEIKINPSFCDHDELPNTKKNIFNRLIRSIHTCIDDESSFLENDKTINDLNLEDLLGQLKTQAFSLSDIITNAINKKEEGVALDYALINDIKYKMIIVKVLSCIIFLKAPYIIDLHLIDD
ncbi:hypothetical protein ACLF9C_05610 [Helicobacter pylori]